MLDLNQGLINILLKGRSASLPPGMDMETMNKQMCNEFIYDILENEIDLMIHGYSYVGGICTINHGSYGSMSIQGCNCSDPKNFNFYDKGRF